jgi:hypothetical protein
MLAKPICPGEKCQPPVSHFANDVVAVAVELLAFPLDLPQANCDNG